MNTETTAVVIPATETHVNILAGLAGFKVAKQVTRTVLQQGNDPFAVTFERPAYEGQELKAGRGSGAQMQPARLADVINLVTGELQTLIMNTVLEGELDRAYPNNAYVGRSFLIRGYKPVDSEGKERRYRVYQIAELEREAEVVTATPVADANGPVNRYGKPVEPDAAKTDDTGKAKANKGNKHGSD